MTDEIAMRNYASETSRERGEDYYEMGSVLNVIRSGDRLFASVQGSELSPYRVCVRLEKGRPKIASCSCPYDWGRYCKHIVAVFLTYLRDPDEVKTTAPLEERLASLDADELRDLVMNFIEWNPKLLPILEDIVQTDDFSILDEEY